MGLPDMAPPRPPPPCPLAPPWPSHPGPSGLAEQRLSQAVEWNRSPHACAIDASIAMAQKQRNCRESRYFQRPGRVMRPRPSEMCRLSGRSVAFPRWGKLGWMRPMGRYLYGDSVPFPLQYNLLSTLDTFLGCAAKAVLLYRELDDFAVTTTTLAATRVKALADLEAVHRTVMHAIQECAARSHELGTLDYAQQLEAQAARIVDE